MRRTFMMQAVSSLMGLGCAIALIGWDMSLLWRIITALLLIISICTGVMSYYRERMRQHERLIRSAHLGALELMNHQRHDWMNDLQLLYGYVRLNKIDKLPHCVETIKARMMEESRIAKLGFPELVLFLLQNRVSGGTMPLQIRLTEQIELDRIGLSTSGEQLTELIIQIVQTFRLTPKQNDEIMELQLQLIHESNELIIRCEYEGKLLQPDEVARQLKQTATERGVRLEQLSTKQHDNGIHIYQWIIPCMTE
ncbi:Spo0B domain-containing protein [Paenibacillus sp. ACRRX]|uniref:Spo0B domain-containing protein n=1 Tax=Paenibacillus sp. ACRRX TaxID=2918206 RepID=UPI001EF4EC83|nr:Spo0B domain-containing protein [Paenibacillus sp. ACRRX]MCG7410215.1 Spo0B domain-containing protein [Paenibacillus sp. ACRRX]